MRTNLIATAALAGLVYFALVFAIGFALGAARVFLIVPAVGETSAVFIELPVILFACWQVSVVLTRRMITPGAGASALLMGGVAFVLLMAAEMALAVSVFERSAADQAAHWLTLAGAAGLMGQIAFALFPWVQVRRGSV